MDLFGEFSTASAFGAEHYMAENEYYRAEPETYYYNNPNEPFSFADGWYWNIECIHHKKKQKQEPDKLDVTVQFF